MNTRSRYGALAAVLLLAPGVAFGQSSNSSSNCSDGRCTRVESWRPGDGRRGHGWTSIETWREGERRDARPYRERDHRQKPRPPRDRRDDDDDDDD